MRLQLLCDRLSCWQEAAGELEQVQATLLRWLALDPLSEEAYRRLMRVHYPDLPAPIQDELTARLRLFEAVARLLDALARRAPLVLLLVAGAAVISMVVAAAVAYQSTRVRPLEVLRYE